MSPKKQFDYPNEGVSITLPEQARTARVERLPVTSAASMPGAPGGFQPGRVVFNFQVVDEDDPNQVLTDFDPPFELRVRYTPADMKRAQVAGKSLELAYWDGSKWVLFTQEKHGFRLESDSTGAGGFGVVTIASWGDPNIAWGP